MTLYSCRGERKRERERGAMGFDPRERGREGGGWVGCGGGGVCDKHMPG